LEVGVSGVLVDEGVTTGELVLEAGAMSVSISGSENSLDELAAGGLEVGVGVTDPDKLDEGVVLGEAPLDTDAVVEEECDGETVNDSVWLGLCEADSLPVDVGDSDLVLVSEADTEIEVVGVGEEYLLGVLEGVSDRLDDLEMLAVLLIVGVTDAVLLIDFVLVTVLDGDADAKIRA
jgi:hypothetical protein